MITSTIQIYIRTLPWCCGGLISVIDSVIIRANNAVTAGVAGSIRYSIVCVAFDMNTFSLVMLVNICDLSIFTVNNHDRVNDPPPHSHFEMQHCVLSAL